MDMTVGQLVGRLVLAVVLGVAVGVDRYSSARGAQRRAPTRWSALVHAYGISTVSRIVLRHPREDGAARTGQPVCRGCQRPPA